MKKILTPTDFSENSINAIKYAMNLFENETCVFYLLNTSTPASYNVGAMVDSYSALKLQEIVKDSSEKNLDSLEESLLNQFNNPKHSFVKIASFNLLILEIIDIVEAESIDLIIMGTQGATGAKEIFLGTHTAYTIKKAKCPVIAVPSGFNYERPKEILFPTDYTLSETNKYLSLLKEICSNHKSKLNILDAHFGSSLNEEQQKIKNYLDHYLGENAHVFHVTEETNVLEAIDSFQTNQKINLLVMFHDRHSFFENMLFKPVINRIAYHTNIPFLVIPSLEKMRN